MRRHHHRSPFTVGVVATMGCLLAGPAAATDCVPAIPRVRSSDKAIAALIEEASKRSSTLKRLVATIEASNGIVFVEPGKCAQGVRACLVMWMKSSGSNRFMRVTVDRTKLDSDSELIGAIGHELQHVIEVLAEPSVTDSDKMFFFYRRYAPTDGDRFETGAATRAGHAVRREIRGR